MTTAFEIARSCAAVRTRRSARLVSRIYDEAFRELGIKGTQFSLLVAIKIGAPESISSFAEQMGLERTTLTRNLQLLEKKGFIEIGAEGYRRARSIHLLPKGQATLDKAIPEWQKAQSYVEEKFGSENWQNTKILLDDMARKLQHTA